MKKFKIGLYAIGVFNGIVFTFAFLCLIVGMDEEFHFMDTEEPLGVDSIVFMDLSSYNIEDIESEYFKRRGPENILDKILHQYSMVGTTWEEKWDSISDIEKVSILLYDTEITDRFKQPQKRKKKCSKVICPINKEYNNLSQGTIEMDSQTTISSFLGKPIIINDSLCEQIAFIANQDKMLSYSDSIVQIGNVRWRINLMPNVIALMTSVQPDDPKMKQVVEYLNGIYGKPYQDDEDGYSIKWSSSGDSLDIFKPGSTLVHLRRVHTEEGGTFLFFK